MSARDLYQELILDHARSPQNFGALEQATAHSHRENISCGDTIDLYLLVENDQIVDVRFEGQGCALSTASASPNRCCPFRALARFTCAASMSGQRASALRNCASAPG